MSTPRDRFNKMLLDQLKTTIVPVVIDYDGYRRTHYLSYVENFTEDNTIKCYDHFMEDEVVLHQNKIVTYLEDPKKNDETFKGIHTQYLSYIDTLNKCNNDQLVKIFENVFGFIDLPEPDKIRLFLANYINEYITIDNNQSDWFYKTYMNIDLESATPPDHMVEMWRVAIDKSQTSAISYLETELTNCETDIEKSSISDILEIVMKYNFDDEMEKNITSTRQLLQYWPSLLLPSPAFVSGESKVSTKLNPATWDTFIGV